VPGLPGVGVERAQPRSAPSLRSGQRQQVGPLDQQLLRRERLVSPEVIAESVERRLEHRNESTSVCSCAASVRPGANGTVTRVRRPSPLLDGGAPAQDDHVASETRLPPALKCLLDLLERLQHG